MIRSLAKSLKDDAEDEHWTHSKLLFKTYKVGLAGQNVFLLSVKLEHWTTSLNIFCTELEVVEVVNVDLWWRLSISVCIKTANTISLHIN